MRRKYGINVVSLWPYCLGPRGPEMAIEIADTAGYDGIQSLPMKGWSYKNIRKWENRVISFEDAFMYGPLWKAVLRQLGILSEPAPLIVDWVLFGRKISPFFPSAIPVAHRWQRNVAVEINPELSIHTQSYLEFCSEGGKLCWDTLHVRRVQRNGTEKLNDWTQLLGGLTADSVELIHVHPSKEEVGDFVSGKASELTQMLSELGAKFPNAPAIVEVFPPLKQKRLTLSFLSNLLEVTKTWLH